MLVSLHDQPKRGKGFWGTEAQREVDETQFLKLCAAAGFETAERIGLVYGQVVHRLRRKAEPEGVSRRHHTDPASY
ncbi:hypothetical protein [Phenylobacterium sp.]|uniref:hypothetical protein n=1 Tax=Phenylobacterium sp. TaxID=1871053 RepID=UPI002EDB22C9